MANNSSSPDFPLIRSIQPEDNQAMAQIIRQVMTEFGCVGDGYSIQDAEVDFIFEAFHQPGAAFLVIEQTGQILGGGGIGPLQGGKPEICELKKMYFLPALRGKGLGKKLVQLLLQQARDAGYQQCYLETVERMTQANQLYQKMGFERLSGPLGNTGHHSCEAQYIKKL